MADPGLFAPLRIEEAGELLFHGSEVICLPGTADRLVEGCDLGERLTAALFNEGPCSFLRYFEGSAQGACPPTIFAMNAELTCAWLASAVESAKRALMNAGWPCLAASTAIGSAAGAFTAPHRDRLPGLNIQISGEKLWLCGANGCASCVVRPGDALLVPAGVEHAVRALSDSLSVTIVLDARQFSADARRRYEQVSEEYRGTSRGAAIIEPGTLRVSEMP